MDDYSVVMATKQKDLSRLYNAMEAKDWALACIIADKLEYEFHRLYDYCAARRLEE